MDFTGIHYFIWSGFACWFELLHFCRTKLASICGYGCSLNNAEVCGFSDLVVHSPECNYRIRFPHRLGPSSVRDIFDGTQENVTVTVLQFAGPGRCFYGIPTTPRMLGFSYLTVEFRTGQTRIFNSDEHLQLEAECLPVL